jgi:hypothetical protein
LYVFLKFASGIYIGRYSTFTVLAGLYFLGVSVSYLECCYSACATCRYSSLDTLLGLTLSEFYHFIKVFGGAGTALLFTLSFAVIDHLFDRGCGRATWITGTRCVFGRIVCPLILQYLMLGSPDNTVHGCCYVGVLGAFAVARGRANLLSSRYRWS